MSGWYGDTAERMAELIIDRTIICTYMEEEGRRFGCPEGVGEGQLAVGYRFCSGDPLVKCHAREWDSVVVHLLLLLPCV